DGLERTHDLIVEREGVFKECILAIKMAKVLGYQVATNTTVYKETDMDEIEQMLDFLSDLGVDGHTITPGYDYDAAKKDMIKRLNLRPENFFLTRSMTIEKFRMGDSHSQHSRLERALLPDDRRPFPELCRATRKNRVGEVWGRRWCGARQP